MAQSVEYLSDKLVNIRGRLRAHQENLAAGNLNPAAPVAPVEPTAPVAAAPAAPTAPGAEACRALLKRLEEARQARRDLEARLARSTGVWETRRAAATAEIAAAESGAAQLRAWQNELEQLSEPAGEPLPPPAAVGEYFRAIDKLRLEYFRTAVCDEAAAGSRAAAPAATGNWRDLHFGDWMKIGLALTLPLIAGIVIATLLGALILFFGWR